jgi:pilus assembly protein CpaB
MALVVGIAVYTFADSLQKQAQAQATPMGNVVTAAVEIPANTLITDDMVTLITLPVQSISAGAATDIGQVAGAIAKYPIFAGEQVFNANLSGKDTEKETLSFVLEEGYRAISIGVDDITGVSGYIKAGDRVDVISSMLENDETGASYTVSTALVENLLVLETGTSIQSEAEKLGYRTVTLAATPEQAVKINYAVTNGRLLLVLRPILDEKIVNPADYPNKTTATVLN